MKRVTRIVGGLAVAGVFIGLAGCSSTAGADKSKSLLVWSLEEQPDRLAKAQSDAADFSKKTGITVKIVGVNEDQFPQLITAAAASGTMPDVVGALPLAAVRTMSSNALANTDAMQQVVDALGSKTFSPAALKYTQDGGKRVGVPSDAFPVSVIYRKDLFAQAGLAPPTTYDALEKAVKTLNTPQMAGFVGGNSPGTSYTQQVFEYLAEANGCQLVNSKGAPALDSKACSDAFGYYGTLNHDYSVPGSIDSTGAKTVYMAGKAAVTVWASFILDEMAGLVNDAKPTCPQCASDPQFIAKNSGFVSSMSGPDGSPASFGEVTSWVISSSANASAAKAFVSYFMSDGYAKWLSQAPEGKFPTRLGTTADPQKYTDAWKNLTVGVDTKAKLADIYGNDVIAQLQKGVNSFNRWGFAENQGALMGAVNAELPIAKAVSSAATGQADGKAAAAAAQKAVVSIKATLP